MYCVKCGVKLQNGAESCPLCGTPVLIDLPREEAERKTYSELYPKEKDHTKFLALGLITVLMAAAALCVLIVCLELYGTASWSGYVMLALALAWIVLVLPFWFERWMPFIFLPVDIAAICGFLLYVCLKTGGKWFLSFAFPVTMITGAFVLAAVVFFRYVKGGKLFVAGGFLVAIGASCMLFELFSHITFRVPMFIWSLYCVCLFCGIGLFLIIAGLIPPFRDYLERKFFV